MRVFTIVYNNGYTMYDVYMQSIFSMISQSSKGELQQYITDGFILQSYLLKAIDLKYRKEITKFRISNYRLNVDVDRYNNVVRPQRVCTLCDHNEIEDGFNLILNIHFTQIDSR